MSKHIWKAVAATVLLTIVAASVALADLAPAPAPSEPPPGADSASIRGLDFGRHYGYFRGHRWITTIRGCVAGAAACETSAVTGCIVIEIAGTRLADGDIAALVTAATNAADRPLMLTLECAGQSKQASIGADGSIILE